MRTHTTPESSKSSAPVSPGSVPGLPSKVTGLVLLVSGVLGLVPSFILAVEKYWLLTNPFYSPSCTLGETVSCLPVMNSWQAEVFGFPNPYIGLVGFALVAATGGALLGGARLSGWYWGGLQAGVTLGTFFVGWLMSQSLFSIEALCPYCMLAWAAMFSAMWYVSLESLSRWGHQRSGGPPRLARTVLEHHGTVLLTWFVLIAGLVIVAALNFS